MTVSSSAARSGPYLTNGTAASFPFTFRVLGSDHLRVVRVSGNTETDVDADAYTVTGVGDERGGAVVFKVPPTAGLQMTIIRDAPFTQQVDLENQGAYYAETVERALDLSAMRDQQLAEQMGRVLRFPITETPEDLVLPALLVRIGKALVFGPDGRLTVSIDDYENQAANAATSAALADVYRQAAADILAATAPASNLLEVPVTTPATLAAILSLGFAALVPASITAMALTASQAAVVLPNASRVRFLASSVDLTLPSGVLVTSAGDIASIGDWRNVRLLGAEPLDLTLASVVSVIGSAGAWDVTYQFTTDAQAAGVKVGMFLKNFLMGPLPNLSGDTSAPTILRGKPVPNEPYMPVVNVGLVTCAPGGASVSFSAKQLTDGLVPITSFLSVGDQIVIKGQQRTITSFPNNYTAAVDAPWTLGVTASRGCWIIPANTGTCSTAGGTPNQTVTFSNAVTATQLNEGDILLVGGRAARITSIVSPTSVTVAPNVACAAAAFAIITHGALHDGAHEILGVNGSQVTVRSKSRVRPPKNRVVNGRSRVLCTVLKNLGPGDGIVSVQQHAGVGELDKLAVVGDGVSAGSIGLCMQGRLSAGVYGTFTQRGYSANYQLGPDSAFSGWGYGGSAFMGCELHARESAWSGNQGTGFWALEGSDTNFRRTTFSGNGGGGALINPGAVSKGTECRVVGNIGDGLRVMHGATGYSEIPFILGNGGMGARLQGCAGFEINEGVASCNGQSGTRFEAQAKGSVKRLMVMCNDRYGIEGDEGSSILGAEAWVVGTTGLASGGDARAVSMSESDFLGDGGSYVFNSGGIFCSGASRISLSGAMIPGALSGVARLNERNVEGGIVSDGKATAFGLPALSVNGSAALTFLAHRTIAPVDAPSIAAGAQYEYEIDLPGVNPLSMGAFANSNNLPAGLSISAKIQTADKAVVVFENNSAAAIDPGNATVNVFAMGAA